jgi:hypothetical protein
MKVKGEIATKATIVFFLASFILGVWTVLTLDEPGGMIPKILHGICAVFTFLYWALAIKRQEAIATRISEVLFVLKNIMGIWAVFIPRGPFDDVLGAIHKLLAFLTLIFWIVAIRKRGKSQA